MQIYLKKFYKVVLAFKVYAGVIGVTFHLSLSGAELYLDNWSKVIESSGVKIFTPRNLLLPDDLSLEFLKSRGLPWILLDEGENRIFVSSGFFSPVPIFYKVSGDLLFVSDNIFKIIELTGFDGVDRLASLDFLEFRNTLADRTLALGVRVLEAGKILTFIDGTLNVKTEYLYLPKERLKEDLEVLEEHFWKLLRSIFQDYGSVLSRYKIILPLSSGYDSRLIISMLHILGFKNVIVVSYGVKDNYESAVAKRVAERLGYKYIFIEYSREEWMKILKDLPKYLLRVSQLFRTPNIQELISTNLLHEKLCEKYDKFIFIPGHISDIVKGKTILNEALLSDNIKELAHAIMNHFSVFHPPYSEFVLHELELYLKKLLKEVRNYYGGSKPSMLDLAEIFHWREVPFKFVSTQMSPYNLYGFKYFVPLWDRRLVQFLMSIPTEIKWRQNFYINFLRKYLFEPLDIWVEGRMKLDREWESQEEPYGDF